MKIADLHTHTRLCNHATGEPEEYLHAAVGKGLSFYGISDHLPSPRGYDAPFRMTPEQFPLYRETVRRMREEGARSGIEVLYAAEYDYVPGRMDEVMQFIKNEKFDYLIGSVHYTEDLGFDDPDRMDEIKSFGADRLWKIYLTYLQDFVSGWKFQILAHCDLPKIFGFRHADPAFVSRSMRSIFELCREKDVMLEINTAGLRKPVAELYPSQELLMTAHECGLRLTFGSDAHKPSDIARDFDKAVEAAKRAGYRSCWTFRQGGTAQELPFD